MLVPVKWLSEYVDIEDIDIKELNEKLIMSGSNTETVKEMLKGVKKVVIGKILSIDGHPDADKLFVLQIDVGEEEPIQIVTGATNCEVGKCIPVALHGSLLADGTKIKKGKLRGVVSNGMLCSLEELGFDARVIQKEYADGIYLFDKDYPFGEDVRVCSEFEDNVIEFEITSNRPDCLSMIGMARETAATFSRTLKLPEVKIQNEVGDVNDYCSVEIADADLCMRYAARVVKDVKMGESPAWMQIRLMKAGMRPINNIVDIANYVMLEYGQPIHTFDLAAVEGNKVIARRAKAGEKLVTLDEVERELNENMLVIADTVKPVALAGIMGGANSEINGETKNILIEVANFEKSCIRKTSKDLGLRSEASSRFEKGVSTYATIEVANRVCQLIEELGAGTVVKGHVDVYPTVTEEIKITLRPARVNQILGTDLSKAEIVDLLNRLEIKSEDASDDLTCHIPECRLDLVKEIDLIEEIARMFGYDKIPSTLPKGSEWGAKTNGQIIEDYAKGVLLSSGLNEITTYSFISPGSFDMIRSSEDSLLRKTVTIKNPLGEEYSVMRTTLMSNTLEVMARNIKRNIEDVSVFEIGNIFVPREIPVVNLPIEKKELSIGVYGKDKDFFTIKGIVCNMLDRLGIKDYKFIAEKNHGTFHTGRCASIVWGNHIIGTIGEVHPKVTDNYDITGRCYLANLDFNILMQMTRLDRIYAEIPKYPAITRDIALLVKDQVTAGEIFEIIESNGGNLLESVKLFDIYKGKQIEEGHKSMAYALVFRSAEKTLTDEEVTKVYDKILSKLEEKIDAKLR